MLMKYHYQCRSFSLLGDVIIDGNFQLEADRYVIFVEAYEKESIETQNFCFYGIDY